MKMNEARTLNNKAVIEEEKKATDPNYNKKIKRDNWMKKINQINKVTIKFFQFKSVIGIWHKGNCRR